MRTPVFKRDFEDREFRKICLIPLNKELAVPNHLPMFRYFAEPLDAGGFEAGVGVETAG